MDSQYSSKKKTKGEGNSKRKTQSLESQETLEEEPNITLGYQT
jgi:hypothetical protein